jgi:hypothetical protein
MRPKRHISISYIGFLAATICLIGFEGRAYEVPLSLQSIYEAYVMGQRNDHATSDFVSPYVKQVSATGADGPRQADIQILTPYSQIVDESRRNPPGYSEEQAIKNYHQRGNTVMVSVVLIFTSAYPKQHDNSTAATIPCKVPALQPESFWQNFRFVVKQRGKILTLRSARHEPVYSSQAGNEAPVLDGAKVLLELEAQDVASETATVEITTPACKLITATFDLKALR